MRLWSLHPKYLDPKGLVALWRGSLLAKHVLEGKTKGYTNHPQLIRFKQQDTPIHYINEYLFYILKEAQKRGYHFDKRKINNTNKPKQQIEVTSKQIEYELKHLKSKLIKREPKFYNKLILLNDIEAHPLFKIKQGEIESWERT